MNVVRFINNDNKAKAMGVSSDNPLPVTVEGGSSSAASTGGGNNTYSNVTGDFTATANSGAKTITFSAYASTTLSSVISALNFANAVIKRVTSGGVVDTLPLTNVAFSANVLTLADMTANFAVGDTVAVFVPGPDKSFDETYDRNKVAEQMAPTYENNSLQRAMTLQGVSYTNISASALIKTGAGYLAGFVVNSASAGATIKLWDSTSAATTVLLNTITFTAAVNQGPTVVLLPSPAAFGTGLYCTIAVAAMDVTLLWL
jgi:hypothetical protein